MSSTILETARSSHEDIELFERAVVQLMINEPRTARKKIITHGLALLLLKQCTDALGSF